MARSFLLALAEEERLKKGLMVNRKVLRDSSNPLELPQNDFVANFRLTKSQFLRLCEEVTPLLPARRSSAIRPEIKILAAIAFYGNGVYQKNVGAFYHLALAQSTVHNCLWEVTEALNHPRVLKKFIKFPMTHEERASVSSRFMDKFQFPGVIGCIDGTHVKILRPPLNEEAYFNRKMYHSLNVLIVCDADLRILHIDASFGGSSHDSHVWNQCPVQNFMQQLHDQQEVFWLLGDSGYAQRDYLMTPILHAEAGSPAEHYTRRHVSTRNAVERCIGVLKSRWRCLMAQRALNYLPVRAGKIVNACAVLHNLINDASFPVEQEVRDDLELQIDVPFRGHQSVSDERRLALVERLWRERRH